MTYSDECIYFLFDDFFFDKVVEFFIHISMRRKKTFVAGYAFSSLFSLKI